MEGGEAGVLEVLLSVGVLACTCTMWKSATTEVVETGMLGSAAAVYGQ